VVATCGTLRRHSTDVAAGAGAAGSLQAGLLVPTPRLWVLLLLVLPFPPF
jgi:hypothetical protein